MNIALDYDETFTADKQLWIAFVRHAVQSGHTVTFVSIRSPHGCNTDILGDAKLLGIECVFTAGKQKSGCFPHADVWIDDAPVFIPLASELNNVYMGCLKMNDIDDALLENV